MSEPRDLGGTVVIEGFEVDAGELRELATMLSTYAETFRQQAVYADLHLKCESAFPFYSEDLWPVYERSAETEEQVLIDMRASMDGLAYALSTAAHRYAETERHNDELVGVVGRMLHTELAPYVAGEFDDVAEEGR
jgi:hypothetical protein